MGSVRFEPLLPAGPWECSRSSPPPREPLPSCTSCSRSWPPPSAASPARIESDRAAREAEFLLELTEAALAAGSMDEMLATLCERVAAMARRAARNRLPASRTAGFSAARLAAMPTARVTDRVGADATRTIAAARRRGGAALRRAGGPGSSTRRWSPAGGPSTFGIESLIAVPIGSPPRAIGVLVVDDPQPERFTAETSASSPRPAAHIAPTIEQARMSAERTSHLRAATAIRRLLQEGSRAVSVEEAGEALARVARRRSAPSRRRC